VRRPVARERLVLDREDRLLALVRVRVGFRVRVRVRVRVTNPNPNPNPNPSPNPNLVRGAAHLPVAVRRDARHAIVH